MNVAARAGVMLGLSASGPVFAAVPMELTGMAAVTILAAALIPALLCIRQRRHLGRLRALLGTPTSASVDRLIEDVAHLRERLWELDGQLSEEATRRAQAEAALR